MCDILLKILKMETEIVNKVTNERKEEEKVRSA